MIEDLRAALTGAGAGMFASVIQAGIGAAENVVLLPEHENADLAPRMVKRVAERIGLDLSATEEWTYGTLYHLAYGAGWGAIYGVIRERREIHPFTGGALMAATIYGITFPRHGGGVEIGAERPPEARSRRMEIVLASITLSFGLATAYTYEGLRGIG